MGRSWRLFTLPLGKLFYTYLQQTPYFRLLSRISMNFKKLGLVFVLIARGYFPSEIFVGSPSSTQHQSCVVIIKEDNL